MAHERSSLARHTQHGSPGPIRQLGTLLAVAACVVLVSAIGVVAYAAIDLGATLKQGSTVLAGQDAAPPDIGELDDVGVNIMLAGLDACENWIQGTFGSRCPADQDYGEADRDAALNDVNMIVHISPEPRRVTVISIPRDLVTSQPECTNQDGVTSPEQYAVTFNEANSRGQIQCIVDSAEQLTGLDIDYGATITWGGVIAVTDVIGGVDVCVAGEGIYDDDTGTYLDPGKTYTLQGREALQFLRTRHGVGDGSDLARISNQQVYMTSLARKLTSKGVLTNPVTLLSLGRTVVQNVEATSSLTDPVTLARMAMAVADVPLDEFVFVQYPVLEDPSNANHVIPDTASAETLFDAIEANEPITLTAGTGSNGAVVEGEDGATSTPTDTATEPETTDPLTPTATATSTAGQQGSNVFGTDASQTTCSSGNG
ncbi:MAG: LCP family protein [Microbacterium sp.]